ncbi:MAG: hypothetical protein PVI28_07130 [Gammaproteobacteria bacterium]|jgi:hypothetical protein
MYRNKLAIAALFGGILVSSSVSAFSLTFSGASSDSTNVDFLDATLDLSVSNAGGNDLLSLTLTNLSDTSSTGTDPDDGFTISQVFFNFSGTSTLTIDTDPLGAASLAFDQPADGFGTFDVLLDLGAGNDGLLPNPPAGNTATWIIDLGGTGFTENDFDLESDPLGPGGMTSTAALFFTQGPCDPEITDSCVEDSAFGSVVPVPAAVWLFGSGLLGLLGLSRRRSR